MTGLLIIMSTSNVGLTFDQVEKVASEMLAKGIKPTVRGLMRILIYVNTDSGQYEHPAFPALGSVLF